MPVRASQSTVSKTRKSTVAKKIKSPPNRELAKQFLNALRDGASVSGAARIAGRPCCSFYNWRRRYPAFEQQWDDAVEEGTDRLEDEAIRRGVLGVEKPIFYGGKLIGHEIRHSDTLLMFLLKGRRPEKFDPGRLSAEIKNSASDDAEAFRDRLSKILSSTDPALAQKSDTQTQPISKTGKDDLK